jgi:hypothetical protein
VIERMAQRCVEMMGAMGSHMAGMMGEGRHVDAAGLGRPSADDRSRHRCRYRVSAEGPVEANQLTAGCFGASERSRRP